MAVQILAAPTSPETPATPLTLLLHKSIFCVMACIIHLLERTKQKREAAKVKGTERQQACLLQDQPKVVSGRMTTSAYVLTGTIRLMQQCGTTEPVLLLSGIQLVDASLANALLSNQCDAGAGTDLI